MNSELLSEKIDCELCQESVDFNRYQRHVERECPSRPSRCTKCNQEYPASLITEHGKVCEGMDHEENKFNDGVQDKLQGAMEGEDPNDP